MYAHDCVLNNVPADERRRQFKIIITHPNGFQPMGRSPLVGLDQCGTGPQTLVNSVKTNNNGLKMFIEINIEIFM